MAVGWRANYLRYKSYFLDVVGHYEKRGDLKMFMELFLSLATISILGIFAIRPTLLAISELLKEIQGKKQTLAILIEKIDNLNRAQTLYEEERANIDLLKVAIPKKGDPIAFVRQIEGVVSQNPINVVNLSLEEVNLVGNDLSSSVPSATLLVLPEGASGLSFSLNAVSDYPKISTFLQALENLRRPFKLDGLLLDTQANENGKELILVLSARSPYLK